MRWAGGGLEGVCAVCLTRDLSGLFCAHRLATLGADVVALAGADVATAVFARHVRTLPVEDPALSQAVQDADIVVDDDAAATQELVALAPSTSVRVVITPFGRTGPYSSFTGTDLTIDAFGGAVSSSGLADRPPVALGGRLVSTYVGAVAAAAAVAELRLATATGEGSIVDVSAVEVLAASMDRRALQLLTHSYTGWDAARDDGSTPLLLNGVHPCSDGWVYVSLYGWHVRTVCELIGDPALASFAERPALAINRAEGQPFREAVLGWLASRPCRDAVDAAQAVGWPVIPASSLPRALDDPWLVGTGLVEPAGEGLRLPASGISVTPADMV